MKYADDAYDKYIYDIGVSQEIRLSSTSKWPANVRRSGHRAKGKTKRTDERKKKKENNKYKTTQTHSSNRRQQDLLYVPCTYRINVRVYTRGTHVRGFSRVHAAKPTSSDGHERPIKYT